MGDISARQDISVRYIDRLIQPLKKAGFISSIRGPKGGYLLTREPGEITLGKVIHVMEGDLKVIDCNPSPDPRVRVAEASIIKVWENVSEMMWDQLESVTLADLLTVSGGGSADSPVLGRNQE